MKELSVQHDQKRVVLSSFYRGDDNGYHSNEVQMTLYEDGSVSFWEESNEFFIYLYPGQIKHLKKLLATKR